MCLRSDIARSSSLVINVDLESDLQIVVAAGPQFVDLRDKQPGRLHALLWNQHGCDIWAPEVEEGILENDTAPIQPFLEKPLTPWQCFMNTEARI